MSYTYTISNTMSSGSYAFSNGSNGIDWTTISPTISVSNNPTHNTLEVRGDATFEGDIKVKGKSITDSLNRIEERLAILRPNEELEEKWENLRALRNAYMELEKEILEKQEMWAILKK